MWDAQVGEKEETAVQVVGEHERSNMAFCNTGVEHPFVGCHYFDVSWSGAGGGKMREEPFAGHAGDLKRR